MCGFKRDQGEAVGEYMQRANRIVRNLKARHSINDWDLEVVKNHFGWAGHVSRFQEYDAERLTLRVLRYRDRAWLNSVEEQNAGRQLHCRILKVWRWEYPLAKYAKSVDARDWHILARDKRSWLENLYSMARWYLMHR